MTVIQLKDAPDAKILIRAANWVGDAIMTTPVIRAIRKNYPSAQITVLAKPWVIPVYAHNPNIDHIMVYDNTGRHKFGWGTLVLSRDIKQHRFDLAVLMQNAFEAAFITFFGGVKERLGYRTDGRGPLLNRGVKLDPALKKDHLVNYYIGILTGAGLKDDGSRLDLFIDEPDRDYARRWLSDTGFNTGGPVIGINPGATGGTAKRWFPERYAKLAMELSNAYGVRIIIFGGPADRKLGDDIAQASKGACVNIAGKTSLSQAFALIGQCRLFVTNDSGLMHAAAALGVNQVAVIGSTDYIATAPLNPNSILVRVPLDCSPCCKKNCPTDHRCMDLIRVDMVMESCRQFLDQDKGKSSV